MFAGFYTHTHMNAGRKRGIIANHNDNRNEMSFLLKVFSSQKPSTPPEKTTSKSFIQYRLCCNHTKTQQVFLHFDSQLIKCVFFLSVFIVAKDHIIAVFVCIHNVKTMRMIALIAILWRALSPIELAELILKLVI